MSLKKLACVLVTATLSCSLLIEENPAQANIFSFSQGGFGFSPKDFGSLTGTFDGADLDNNGSLELGEINAFSVNGIFSTTFFGQPIGSTFTLTKNDLEFFSYSLNSSSPLTFTAGNPGSFYPSVNACLSASNPTAFGCGIPLVSVGSSEFGMGIASRVLALTIRGGGCNCSLFSSSETVEVVQSSTSVPEPGCLGGILLISLGAFVNKRINSLIFNRY